jgi:hypothetical protein
LLLVVACTSTQVRPLIFPLVTVGRRVAVLELVDLRDSDTRAKFPSPAQRIQERLISGLAQQRFTVVERNALNAILTEQSLAQSGITAEGDAATVGKLAKADVVLIGSILTYDRPVYPKARLALVLRAVAVATGTVEKTIEVDTTKNNWVYPVELLEDTVDVAIEEVLKAIQAAG